MRKMIIALLALFLLIALAEGCGNKNAIDTGAQPDRDESNTPETLDARVEELSVGDVADGQRAPGEVIVSLKDGVTEGEAYQIFTSHGFDKEHVEQQYTRQIYLLHFSEDERDIKSVIRELLLDNKVKNVSVNALSEAME